MIKSHQWLPMTLRIQSKYILPWSLGTLPTSEPHIIVALSRTTLATLVFWLLYQLAKIFPASGPLHQLFPLPRKLLV